MFSLRCALRTKKQFSSLITGSVLFEVRAVAEINFSSSRQAAFSVRYALRPKKQLSIEHAAW